MFSCGFSGSMVLPDVTANCDHEVVKSKTLGKLSVKCAGCGSRKKWPWVKMARCHHCKKLWHRQCAPTSRPLPRVTEGLRDHDTGDKPTVVVVEPSGRDFVQPKDVHRSSSYNAPRAMFPLEQVQSEISTAVPSTSVAENIVSAKRNEHGRTLLTALPIVEAEAVSTVPESQRRLRRNTARAPRTSPQNTGLIFAELSRCGLLGRFGANGTASRPLPRAAECSPTRVAESRQGFDPPPCEVPSRPMVRLNQSQSARSTSNVTESNVNARNGVRQTFIEVIVRPKMHFLLDLLSKIADYQSTVIVFVNEIVCADRVAALLNVYKYSAASIHSGKQNYENQILTDLNNKVIRILVATDGYSRLIDRTNAKLVVNYDLTKTIQEYDLRTKRLRRLNIESDKEVVSFFLQCNDENLTPALVRTLRRSNQIIPSFLLRDE